MRRATVLLIATFGLLPFVNSCKDLGTPTGKTDISGTYAYKAFDLYGVEVGSGALILRRSDSQLSGELRIGQQVTLFEGRVLDSMRIELYETPTVLRGVKEDGTIRGDVLFDTGGPLFLSKTGTFRAERIGN